MDLWLHDDEHQDQEQARALRVDPLLATVDMHRQSQVDCQPNSK
jgi:hypothetical protein